MPCPSHHPVSLRRVTPEGKTHQPTQPSILTALPILTTLRYFDRVPELAYISPFFIVSDVCHSATFYNDILGFEVQLMVPQDEPFFAIVGRDGVRITLKAIDPATPPQPNWQRHDFARWDAFVGTSDPDALASEFKARGACFREALADHDDGLRGFAVYDNDEYVLFFGRPV
jgi:hypothetical protein